ncbi:hypothetical protein M3Y94_00401700 [Aphelenchoides besseyi]|nr:hypothetical protein M3Y94_00401700 [Aphelenchoides besseyi]
MEIAQPKPRLDSPVVREAFFRFFESHKADDWPEAHIRRNLRLIVIFKEFAANIRARLYGTKFSLLDGKLWGNCEGPFAELFGDVLDQQETKLFLAFVKPKLQELVLDLSLIKPYRNDQLINYFVGTPHLVIMETKSYESGYPLLEKLAPDVTKFKCPSAYLQYDLPPMSLETCVVEIYDQPKINLGPLCSKSQIRQLRLEIQHRLEFRDNFREFEIVCGGRYRNLSVEELILIDDHDKRVHLPDNLLECFPNLKRVFLSFFCLPLA